MKTLEQEYNALKAVAERAKWLLDKGVKAEVTINPATLAPAYIAKASDWSLPGFFETEDEAIESGRAFLLGKILEAEDKSEGIQL